MTRGSAVAIGLHNAEIVSGSAGCRLFTNSSYSTRPMQAHAPEAPFDSESTWASFPGFVYGLRQPALVGRLRLASPGDSELAALDKAIAALADDLPYTPAAATGAAGLAMRIAHLTSAIQLYSKIPVADGHALADEGMAPDGSSVVRLALPCHVVEATRLCLQWVLRSIHPLQHGHGQPDASVRQSFAALMKSLRRFAMPGLNAFYFIRAGHQLDIPVEHWVAGIYRFGTGCHARLLASSATDQTPSLSVKIARNKLVTAQILRNAGLPASRPIGVVTAENAVAVAHRLGFPVVVKPIDRDQGEGVFAGLADESAVRHAFAESEKFSKRIIVERHFPGRDFRVTVFRGRVVKVEERIAGAVTGDGCSTVAELVAQRQTEPRFRKIRRETGKVLLTLDAEALSLLHDAGLAPESVVEAGRCVPLRRKNNASTGGDQLAVALTDIHPDNLALAERAAALLRLDFAGIDLLISDITRSWMDSGALICEVNAVPQVGIRTSPTIYTDILRELVGPVARIPAHLLITAEAAAPEVSQVLRLAGQLSCNGVSTGAGVWIDGQRLPGQHENAWASARTLLAEPAAQGVLCVVPAREILRKGLPSGWFDSIRVLADPAQFSSLSSMCQPHTAKWIEGRLDA